MPKLKLTGTNILLQPLPQKLRSDGGILFSANYRDDETQFRVLAVGPGRWIRRKGKKPFFKACEVEVGDHVLTEQVHGNKLQMPNGVIIIEHDEIIAKWRPGVSRE